MMRDKEQQAKYLKALKRIREEKDVDEIGELFKDIISMYGMTADEVASMCYYLMLTALQVPVTKRMLADEFSIDIDRLGPEGVLQVQRALMAAYVEKIKEG